MDIPDPREAALTRARALKKTFHVVQELAKACPPINAEVRAHCIYCEQPGLHTCGQCQSARYCSRECQEKDWPVHQLVCYSYLEFSDAKRPSTHHARAIVFLAEENSKPRFIWIEEFTESGYSFPVIDCWLGSYARYSNMVTDMNEPLDRAGHWSIGHGLLMIGLNEQPVPGVPVNASIVSLGRPGHIKTWFGNQIVVARKPNEKGARGITLDDVDLRDFRHAVDLYQHHPLNPCITSPQRYNLPTVPGVITNTPPVHCDGALKRLAPLGLHSRIEPVTIPLHCLETPDPSQNIQEDACAALLKLGLRWFCRRFPPSTQWPESEISSTGTRNLAARHLATGMRRTGGGAGGGDRLSMYQVRDAGTVVVFDQGGAAVQPAHVEAVNAYWDGLGTKVAPREPPAETLAEDLARQRGRQRDAERAATARPSMEGFKAFWELWRARDDASAEDLEAVESPYAMRGTLGKEDEQFMAEVFRVALQTTKLVALVTEH
ncbi:hypothetical protein F5Y15DRAFT_422527 [Xylariaceae sp. FL0016]|nr:hypothetical protein F5Y15DRAFT_422527 [Xylariaceae sp. FL0016]